MPPELKTKSDKPAPESPSPPRRLAGITARVWIIGLLMIPLLMFWLEYDECVESGPDLAGMSLPMAVVVPMLVLIAVNLIVKRIAPTKGLTQADLLYIYAMNTVAIGIGGLGMMQFLNPAMVGWSYFARPANHWNSWQHFLPTWAIVTDPNAIADYYAGRTTLFTPAHLAAWAEPVAIWSAFIFVMLFSFYCINTLMRRQWVEREKLIFPIVIIPLEITKDGGNSPLWRNKLFWLAVGIASVLESAATIHYTMLPTFPYIPIKPSEPNFNLGLLTTTAPWSAIGYTTVAFYPMVIGLTYLLSLDVSFSCWFFYLLTKVENVAATALGFRDPGAGPALSRIPYTGEQAVGAFLGLALFTLYFARPHLRAAWRRAFCNDHTEDDSDEPMTYRAAWLGLFASTIGLVAFAMALGLTLWIALLFWTLFLLFALTFTRIRAEAGLPWCHEPPGAAHANIVNIGGTQELSPTQLVAFSQLRWFDTDWRCFSQPTQLEAMKIASSTEPEHMNPRSLTAAVLAAIVVGTLCAWVCCVGIYYHYGASTAGLDPWRVGQGHYGYDEMQGWLNNPKPFDSARFGGALVGLAIVSLLTLLRTQFVWWPLHPIGYAVGNTDTMTWIWCPVLIGWLCKALIFRYGGVKIYRQALPFFIGLVLGDYAISGLWAFYFLLTGHTGYRTFPI